MLYTCTLHNVSDSINAAKHRIVLFGDNPWIESNIVYFPRFTKENTRIWKRNPYIESPFISTLPNTYIYKLYFLRFKIPLDQSTCAHNIPCVKYCSATAYYYIIIVTVNSNSIEIVIYVLHSRKNNLKCIGLASTYIPIASTLVPRCQTVIELYFFLPWLYHYFVSSCFN